MGVVLINWAWLKILRALRARLYLQPHHCKNPRSAPAYLAPCVQRFSKILQHTSKSGSYVLANQNADFKSRFELVLGHAHESSLCSI